MTKAHGGQGHGGILDAEVAAARPPQINVQPWEGPQRHSCRVAASAASAIALSVLCIVAAWGASRNGTEELLEAFDSGPDPDAPGGTRGAILGDQRAHVTVPSGAAGGPRQQDYYYRHVYTYTGYPEGFAGTAVNSENSVAVERLHRVTNEIQRAETQFAQIDRQRAGVKAGIARLTKEEEGLNMEAKSVHENLMRYTAEQQTIIGEMSDAPKKDEGGVEEEAEEEAEGEEAEAEGESGEAETEPEESEAGTEETENAGGAEPSEGGAVGQEGAEGAAEEQAADEDASAEGEVTTDARVKALEDRVDSLEKELHGEAAEKGAKVSLLKGAKASALKARLHAEAVKRIDKVSESEAVARATALLRAEGADVQLPYRTGIQHGILSKGRAGAANAVNKASSTKASVKIAAGKSSVSTELTSRPKAATANTHGSILNAFF